MATPSAKQGYPFVFLLTASLVLIAVLVVVAGTTGSIYAARRVISTTAEHKQQSIRDLVTNPNIPISNLYYYQPGDSLRPLMVPASSTSISEEGVGRAALPEDCLIQFSDQSPPAEICVAFSSNLSSRKLLVAVDYCSAAEADVHTIGDVHLDRRSRLRVQLSSSSDTAVSKSWVVVFQRSGRVIETTGYRVNPVTWLPATQGDLSWDRSLRGELWSAVTRSNRCPNAKGRKERVRFSIDLTSETARLTDPQYILWMRDLRIRLSVLDRISSLSNSTDFVPYTGGEPRFRPATLLASILAPGESVVVGLSADGVCKSHDSQTLAENANPIELAKGAPDILAHIADRLVRLDGFRDLEDFCVVSPKTGQQAFILYKRSAALNSAIVAAFLTEAAPWVTTLALFAIGCAALLYLQFGRRLRSLVSQLRKARGESGRMDRSTFADSFLKEFIGEKNEIGTTAAAFRDLLTALHQHDENRRQLEEIISHEIRTPVHNLRNALPESHDVRRMVTALEVLDQINDSAQGLRDAASSVIRPIAELLEGWSSANQDEFGPIACSYETGAESALYDPELLGLTLNNLVKNAARFRDPGTPVRIRVRSVDGSTFISVSNAGPDIPFEDRERIFELGYTKSGPQQEAARRAPNRGIGLFVSRYYVRLMRGDMRLLESNGGAQFEIQLPTKG